jgi:hypothetical protein
MSEAPSGQITDAETEFEQELQEFVEAHGADLDRLRKAYIVRKTADKLETGDL